MPNRQFSFALTVCDLRVIFFVSSQKVSMRAYQFLCLTTAESMVEELDRQKYIQVLPLPHELGYCPFLLYKVVIFACFLVCCLLLLLC